VLRIFEACNFQDLTGQRITKVLATLQFVEERIARLIDIAGGIEAFKSQAMLPATGRGAMLHGPKLDGDDGHLSQADVDAILAAG
jgi:chemotaxis protein CheZ